ncbi:unnamed protein product [Didymodactylos carnosus]|uniref:Uncharacterized protein n=1 Tax=Didymodactylos carnosus TaxID=1234261 RepID=A0A8S2JV04_9BILA|nr:unnamed protein product [Didymodactylos carnosus]CAF3823102.1 unnamed protein product [Didymodactylos carnosus]
MERGLSVNKALRIRKETTSIQIPEMKSFYMLFIPMAFLGLGESMIEATMLPEIGSIVDKRYSSVIYANAYAIGSSGLCLGLTAGKCRRIIPA